MKLTKEECKDSLNELFVYSKHIANKVEIVSLIECYERLEQLIEEYFDMTTTCENLTGHVGKLEKALDKACDELVTMINAVNCWDYESCPFRSMCKEGTNYCHDKEKWKEYLFDETN